jgi:DNA repair protein SbcC/Rad50
MIVRTIRVEAWRCFVEPLEVGPFAEDITILHAPNATGKSTLLAAMRHGFCDHHRAKGDGVEALRPWGRSLSPIIRVDFLSGGIDYRLEKRYLEGAFSRILRLEGGRFVPVAEGREADELARTFINSDPPGKGLAYRPENWGLAQVLWVPQGRLPLTGLSGNVIADLQRAIGAELAGTIGGPIEKRIDAAYYGIFTPGGSYSKGCLASKLRAELERECAALAAATEHWNQFQNTSREVEDLRSRVEGLKRTALDLEHKLEAERERAASYAALITERDRQRDAVARATAEYGQLDQTIRSIVSLREERGKARSAIALIEESLPRLSGEVASLAVAAEEKQTVLEEAKAGADAVRAARALADMAGRFVSLREKVHAMHDRLEIVSAVRAGLAERRRLRSAIIAPSSKALAEMRSAIAARDRARAALEAALVTLEIVPDRECVADVVAGEELGLLELEAGRPIELKGSPAVVVNFPGFGKLRARGPVGDIEGVRKERERAAGRLTKATEGYGTADLDELEERCAEAARVDVEISNAEAKLSGVLGGQAEEELRQERARATAALEEISAGHPEWLAEYPDVEALRGAALRAEEAFEMAVVEAEANRDAKVHDLNGARAQESASRRDLENRDRQAERLESQLRALTADGLSDEDRARRLAEIAIKQHAAGELLRKAEDGLARFGDDPRVTVVTLESQLAAANEASRKGLIEEKLAEGRLKEIAKGSPYAALARAEESVTALKENLAREECRADAIRLLHLTVSACRKEIENAVVAPVEQIATRTLHRIAGVRLGSVQLGSGFKPETIEPGVDDVTGQRLRIGVDQLSDGESEQLHFGVRLALAEHLAKDERQLVVFDDVLLATDAVRLARMTAILEDYAQRLQVVILTCHPERYGGLKSARFIDLEAVLRVCPTDAQAAVA